MPEHAQWSQKLESYSLLLAKCLQHIPLERRILVSRIGNRCSVPGGQAGRCSASFRRESPLQRLERADEIQCRRRSAEPRGDLACEVFAYAVELLIRVSAVDTVHDEHDFLPPLAYVGEKVELARGQRLQQARHEKNEIGAGNELPRDLLLHPLDGVGAWRIDDVEVAKHLERIVIELHVFGDRLGRASFAMTQYRDRARRRQVAHREHFIAEEGVDESALAAVVLTDDDEEEELVHLVDE